MKTQLLLNSIFSAAFKEILMILLLTVKPGWVSVIKRVIMSVNVVYFCTIVLKGHFILMVGPVSLNICKHQTCAIMFHFRPSKKITENMGNFLILVWSLNSYFFTRIY